MTHDSVSFFLNQSGSAFKIDYDCGVCRRKYYSELILLYQGIHNELPSIDAVLVLPKSNFGTLTRTEEYIRLLIDSIQ
jgi:hypothetical protein